MGLLRYCFCCRNVLVCTVLIKCSLEGSLLCSNSLIQWLDLVTVLVADVAL